MPDPISLPPIPVPIEAIARAIERYHELERRYRDAVQHRYDLEGKRPQAEQADRETAADAIERGDDDLPAQEHVQALEAELAEAIRREEAAGVALERQGRRIQDAVEEHRDAWCAAASDDLSRALAAYRKALTDLGRSANAIREARAMRYFAERYPVRWKQGADLGVKAVPGREPIAITNLLGPLEAAVAAVGKPTTPTTTTSSLRVA